MMNQSFPLSHLDDLASLVLETAPLGIVVTNSSGQIVLLSAQAKAWFGYSTEELQGKPVEVLVPHARHSAHAKCRMEYMSQPVTRPLHASQNFSGRRKDGSEFPVDISLHPLETDSGSFIVANIFDVTTRGLAEVRHKHVQMERLAAIGEAVTGLAHESRNSLQRAWASLDLLELDIAVGSETLALINKVRDALNDLRRNYEDVKNYAAPIVLCCHKVNLLELCEEAFQDLLCEHRNGDHRFTIERHRHDAIAKVDPHRMKQLFRNVIENSLMAVPDGVELVTSANQIEIDGLQAIEIEIRDNGDGLDPQTALRLFEPFYTTKQHGIGLGLAICRRIVEAHNGRIHATSQPGGGTTIGVTVPKGN